VTDSRPSGPSRPARLALLLATAAAAGLAAGSAWAEPIRLSDRAPFAEASGVSGAVRAECGIERALPEDVRAAARDVELVSGPAKGPRTLELSITEVQAPGGGPFSGPKWMTVEATLREGGKTVATARANRATAEPFGGTCGQLRKVSRAIGADLAAWLASPTRDAALGDAR
jgi:hypothetical protein